VASETVHSTGRSPRSHGPGVPGPGPGFVHHPERATKAGFPGAPGQDGSGTAVAGRFDRSTPRSEGRASNMTRVQVLKALAQIPLLDTRNDVWERSRHAKTGPKLRSRKSRRITRESASIGRWFAGDQLSAQRPSVHKGTSFLPPVNPTYRKLKSANKWVDHRPASSKGRFHGGHNSGRDG
jgi:hypothetical protein